VPMWTAEMWDPNQMADIIASSGAKYMVITSKYHDGFCLWPSAQSWNWNSVDMGPMRDIVGELATAVRKTNVTFGVYHSLYEWFNPLYLEDKNTSYPPTTHKYIDQVLMPQLLDVVNRYKPEIIWSDGDWEQPSSYWESTSFLAWLYNESPVADTVVVNDRWGNDCRGKNGGYWTPYDGFNPGHLLHHKWEDSDTIGTSYGYNRAENIDQFSTQAELIQTFVQVVSTGGNLILGVGPTKDGLIPVIIEERLRQLGAWLQINGEAIYSTDPWRVQNDTVNCDVWFTTKQNITVYAIFFDYPDSLTLNLYHPIPTNNAIVNLIGYSSQPLKWMYADDIMTIQLPPFTYQLSTQPVWALKMTGVN